MPSITSNLRISRASMFRTPPTHSRQQFPQSSPIWPSGISWSPPQPLHSFLLATNATICIRYTQRCQTCQQVKGPTQTAGNLSSLAGERPFQLVGWNIMGPFPPTTGVDRYIIVATKYIIVATEHLTRCCEVTAIPDMTASTVAHFLLHSIILCHTCPETFIPADQGRQFVSER